MRRRTSIALMGAMLGVACGPGADPSGDPTSETTETPATTESPTTTGTMPTGGTTGSPTSGPDDTTTGVSPTDGSYEDDGSGTGCTFTCPPPLPPPPEGGTCNCPEGEKCMPWANDGGMEWNSIRCSEIAEDPGQPGEPCTVEGNQWSGIDSCDANAMCWVTDPDTNEGSCISFCSWFGGETCDPGYECQAQPGDLMLPLCAPTCDPTSLDCLLDGMGCFPGGASFTCQPAAQMRAPAGDPCPDPASCEAGALCGFGVDCGQPEGEGCCVTVCDTTELPDPCPMPAVCTPWFGGAGPAQWEHVGYCAP